MLEGELPEATAVVLRSSAFLGREQQQVSGEAVVFKETKVVERTEAAIRKVEALNLLLEIRHTT